ncbi:helix-turn-helix transcriptional regulator [Listeria seeligeri]|uniref:helix-turn-helix domain-containing protein n=1 Tax=Listeria TaxID=1637 RepID=UPI001624997C|nr:MULTISPECIES: helix-turn-helix transcriptional regulator [Listeria]MBC1532102.1 helix-turn-helix transcriptional regulator [Listeria seeligeri]MBC1827084.1 helix-turn-helix transcriptional regulator [Listeria seeligeri]MBC1840122.1 helix-turn-helix transcriptional regulator [Listeria seeligeri]MBC6141871.1 helix-turn-helix transcriptional regulator [Listeria seeligeri]MBC6302504.1 helix-turn-helix transcriptional regulator [Listeria immobilis]
MFAERLRELRKIERKTQQQMADLLGVSRPAYTAYELGRREPDFETLDKLAHIFGVTVDYLLGRSDSKSLSKNGFTLKEEMDMKKRIDALKKDLKNGDGLLYDGEPISEEAMESILDAMEFAEKQATRINRKYAPKNKKNNIE